MIHKLLKWIFGTRKERIRNGIVIMRCVFHNEITPSLVVDMYRGTFVCFGCGKSGKMIDLPQKAIDKILTLSKVANNGN